MAQREARHFEWVAPDPPSHDTADRMFTLYDSGRYAEFDALTASFTSFQNPFEFQASADDWIAAAPDRPRRAFIAATVALEQSRATSSSISLAMLPQADGTTSLSA